MARIITFSIRNEDEWLIDRLRTLDGSMSGHIVTALKRYVSNDAETFDVVPEWYVPGADYSHLDIEVRQKLVQFGYTDSEVHLK